VIDRRAFLAGTGAVLLAAPLAAEAQRAGRPAIGVLYLGAPEDVVPYRQTFRQGLRERGYVEGENVDIEYRYAYCDGDRLPALATELVATKVAVIVTAGTTSVQAAWDATKTIPIVIAAGADPVEMQFAQSLARPGGNITGLSTLAVEIGAKRLELLLQAVPRARAVAVLLHGRNPGNATFEQALTTTALRLGVGIYPRIVRAASEFEEAFAAMRVKDKADAAVVIEDPVFACHAKTIADLALRHRLPTMLGERLFVHAGGLMAYGPEYQDLVRKAATYVDKILKGAKPGDLPIEQPTKFELVISLKTAKALGLTIPQSLLARADEIIQ
jgi:putative ABC transport system substrate-binding protein